MTVIAWFILPIVCVVAVAIYLYHKVKAMVSCLAASWSPNYMVEQLAETIKENNITILEDDTAVINDEVTLIGRADRGDGNENRKEISDMACRSVCIIISF